MAVYARSDMMSVFVPAESGGCGQPHSRPVINGVPAKIWKLGCSQCEKDIKADIARSTYTTYIDGKKHVVNNGTWSESQLHVPLTPDESEVADAMEKSGQTIMHQVAEGMSRQAIENMQAQQSHEIQQVEATVAAAAATARVSELEAQLAEMQKFLQQMSAIRNMQANVIDNDDNETSKVAQVLLKDMQAAPQSVTSVTTCASCGGPLRQPGDRGPTLKGTCRTCRAKARKGAA
jgi:paraquat-inducible protein B